MTHTQTSLPYDPSLPPSTTNIVPIEPIYREQAFTDAFRVGDFDENYPSGRRSTVEKPRWQRNVVDAIADVLARNDWPVFVETDHTERQLGHRLSIGYLVGTKMHAGEQSFVIEHRWIDSNGNPGSQRTVYPLRNLGEIIPVPAVARQFHSTTDQPRVWTVLDELRARREATS